MCYSVTAISETDSSQHALRTQVRSSHVGRGALALMISRVAPVLRPQIRYTDNTSSAHSPDSYRTILPAEHYPPGKPDISFCDLDTSGCHNNPTFTTSTASTATTLDLPSCHFTPPRLETPLRHSTPPRFTRKSSDKRTSFHLQDDLDQTMPLVTDSHQTANGPGPPPKLRQRHLSAPGPPGRYRQTIHPRPPDIVVYPPASVGYLRHAQSAPPSPSMPASPGARSSSLRSVSMCSYIRGVLRSCLVPEAEDKMAVNEVQVVT